MHQHILITGGTGLIGTRLTEMLLEKGYAVAWLSREKKSIPHVKVYAWDIEQQKIEPGAIEEADYIIHLAGAGVADKRWTDSRRKEILESRTLSATLLYEQLRTRTHQVKTVISSSAIGIYGYDTGSEWITEDSLPGDDFLAEVCKAWERSVQQIHTLGIRTVSLRIGLVVSSRGGALPKLAQPIKVGAGTVLGSGKQYISWIHVDDACRMFIQAVEDIRMQGAYNAVGPGPVTNEEMTRLVADILGKPIILPNAPAFALKLAMGEMANIVLGGSRVSNKKITDLGFSYHFSDLKAALLDQLNSE